jgi:hypothetical protein
MGGTWGKFEVIWDDVKQVGEDVYAWLQIPFEILYNDWKIIEWAWNHKILGGLSVIGGFLWGSIILKNMPGDFALLGPIVGAMTGGWGMYWLSTTMSGQTPPDWQVVQVVNGAQEPFVYFTEMIGFLKWWAVRPWESNTSFVAGATLGWLIAPDFPMSAVALLGGIAGVAAGYYYLGAPNLPASNPPAPGSP